MCLGSPLFNKFVNMKLHGILKKNIKTGTGAGMVSAK